MNRLPAVILLACLVLTPAQARLGESFAKLKERYGKPFSQTRKDSAVWLFEAEDGQLAFTVTFNAKDQSIAEGLKPIKRARLTRETAEGFIDTQVAPLKNSKTMRIVNPGEKYSFGGQVFTCDEQEYVVVDDANSVLVVWTRVGIPTVIAVSHEMVR